MDVESWRRSIAVLALSSVAGCALTLSGPPANRPRSERPQCDTSKGLVGLDAAFGSVFGTASLVAFSTDSTSAAVVTGLIAVAYIGSALRGNSTVNECREALVAYDNRNAREEPAVATTPPRGEPALPPEYAQPQSSVTPPVIAPPVVTPPVVAPPMKKGPRPAPPADGPTDWRDFWTEIP